MNTQKNVNQRLSKLYTKDTKQELSSEKVELALERVDLALIDGIAKDLDKVGDDWVRAEGILSKFGNEVVMFDVVDDFCVGAYENYVFGHGQKRVEFYDQQQFNYKVININL